MKFRKVCQGVFIILKTKPLNLFQFSNGLIKYPQIGPYLHASFFGGKCPFFQRKYLQCRCLTSYLGNFTNNHNSRSKNAVLLQWHIYSRRRQFRSRTDGRTDAEFPFMRARFIILLYNYLLVV